MSDFISVQDAVVGIVTDAMQKIMSGEQELTCEYEQSVKDAVKIVLDSVERVTYCKDCAKYSNGHCYYGITSANDFCSLAER